jgi:hypothetical protein
MVFHVFWFEVLGRVDSTLMLLLVGSGRVRIYMSWGCSSMALSDIYTGRLVLCTSGFHCTQDATYYECIFFGFTENYVYTIFKYRKQSSGYNGH